VYLAEHLRLKRKVALKVLAPELAQDERFRERFIRESELAASLDHPNIVTVHDAGEAGGLLYIAMRLVDGTDLESHVKADGSLSAQRTASIVTQVASALDAAHAKGLIHRDVKPANIMISSGSGGSEVAYLTDFGLTKRPDQTTGITRTGQFMGSVDYAAPEQFEGKPLDPRTDEYSLACLAYHCLTGRVPYQRDQEAAVMFAHLKTSPPKVSEVRTDLSPRVDVVVSKGMAKRPESRYPSAGAFADDLRDALSPEPGATPPGGPRRRGMALLAAGVVVAAVVAGILFLSNRSNPHPKARPRGGATPSSGGPAVPGTVGVVRLDPGTGQQVQIPLPLALSNVRFEKSITTGRGFVWLYDGQSQTLFKISPQTNTKINDLLVAGAVGVAFGQESVWLANDFFAGEGAMYRVDPTTFSTPKRIDVTLGGTVSCCVAVADGDGFVWALGSGQLIKVDPKTNGVVDTVNQGGTDLTVGGGKVWVLDGVLGRLFPIDPATDTVESPVLLAGDPIAVSADAQAVWVLYKGGTVEKHPLTGNSGLDSVPVGANPNDVFVGGGSVWVANYGDGTVTRIDPISGIPQTIQVGGHPTQVTADDKGVWIVEEPASTAFGQEP
jgi:serine/threonine protein kinase